MPKINPNTNGVSMYYRQSVRNVDVLVYRIHEFVNKYRGKIIPLDLGKIMDILDHMKHKGYILQRRELAERHNIITSLENKYMRVSDTHTR